MDSFGGTAHQNLCCSSFLPLLRAAAPGAVRGYVAYRAAAELLLPPAIRNCSRARGQTQCRVDKVNLQECLMHGAR